MKTYKNNITILIVLPILLIGGFFVCTFGVNAQTASYQRVDLGIGWNIVSTPKVLSSHEFSVSGTSANFDIYLLSPNSISGWKTMQEAGQTEFQPLFSYFINNKTGQAQTLKFYYNDNLSPSQRLFERSLSKGWNTIGIANPEYAIKKGTSSADTNNPSKILHPTLDCVSDIIDFTADQSSLDSVKVGNAWTNKISTDINSLNDFRELKGYGVYVTTDNCLYKGSQNINDNIDNTDLTLNKIGPSASNIGKTTSDTNFLEFTMSAATDITIKRTRLAFMLDKNGDGTFDSITSAGPGIEDIKVKDKDSGVVVIGSKDGTAFNDGTTTMGANAAVYEDFTDTLNLTAGQTKTYQLTADVKADSSNGDVTVNTVMAFALKSYADLVTASGNLDYMKYADTNEAVPGTAITPSGDILGPNMTVAQASSLAITLAATPSGTDTAGAVGTARTFVTGQSGVSVNGFIFTVGSASDMKVTALNLTSYIDYNADGTYVAGVETTYVKDLVATVEIWDTTTNAMIPGSTAKSFTGTDYKTVAYTGLNWIIPAGESRTLLVKVNLSSNTPATAFEMISFDIADVSADVTAQDEDSNSVDATGDASNGATNPNVSIAIYPYGSIAVVAANDTPDQNVLLMGSTNNEVSKYKLTGTREAFNLDTFSVGLDEDELADRTNFTGVAIKYQTAAQYGTSSWTVSSKKQFGATATVSFTFAGDARPYIPKDDSSYITALVDIDAYNAGTGAHSGDYFRMLAATTVANEIKAYGAQSGTLVNTATQPADTGFNYQYIFRSKPFFEKVAWSGDNLELARFSITAIGYDVTFDGTSSDGMTLNTDTVVSASLEFDVMASGTDETTQTYYLYDWNNNIVSSVSAVKTSHADNITENDANYITSISFQFEEASNAIIIPQGTTKTFYVMLDNANDFNNCDEYIYLKLNQNEGAIDANSNYDNCSVVWYDGTDDEGGNSFEHRICMPASIKNIGAFPFTFRSLTGTTCQ
ncbi:MAG: hypothetical protein V1686_00630 [Patescibacteria group bacterium]